MAVTDHRMALPQGTRVQDFEFHRVLGHGGFGITYLSWNVALDIAVAIKEYLPADLAMREQDMSVLPKSSGDEADFQWGLDRFLDEARVMARFKHPNIVQVQHFFQAHGTAYIVMEYVEGETLSDLLKRRGTLTESELKHILLPLLAGLIDVHEAGILHRDIKPGNILLRAADGSPVLVDFGAARQAVGTRSRSVTAVLTPGYAPIEQYSSRGHQGPWTDMYALGGVCYQALTGRVPDEAMDRIRSDPLIPVTEAAKGKATDAFLSAIDWALRVEEGDRPQGIRLWRAALLGEENVPEPVSADRQSPTPDKKTKASREDDWRIPRWLLTLGLFLLAGAGAWWGWQAYPGLFGQSTVDAPAVAEQEAPVEVPGETPQEVETGETGEALAGTEHTPPPDKAAFEQPASKESPMSKEAAEVDRLLAAAEVDLKARRLTSPVGNNAWEKYQEVLKLDSGNPEAVKGMERVIGSYMELFGSALGREEFEQADTYLSRIRDLHPDSPALLTGKKQLEDAKQARTNRLAEQKRQRQAEEAARQAEEAARQAELERKRQEAEEKARQLAGELVDIPGGTFRMGDLSGDGNDDEKPVHSVRVPAFKLGKYEVTVGQFRRFVEASGYRTDAERNAAGNAGCRTYTGDGWDWTSGRSWRNPGFSVGDDHPAVCVSWNDTQAFIAWLAAQTGKAFRLPSEAEWEYAARAGSTTKYHFGNSESQLCRYGNHADSSTNFSGRNKSCSDGVGKRTAVVGRYQPNSYGLYDMHGNVWEWAEDCWNGSYAGAPSDGRAWELGNCYRRVVRGGSWSDSPRDLRSAGRGWNPRSTRRYTFGFRLAQDK